MSEDEHVTIKRRVSRGWSNPVPRVREFEQEHMQRVARNALQAQEFNMTTVPTTHKGICPSCDSVSYLRMPFLAGKVVLRACDSELTVCSADIRYLPWYGDQEKRDRDDKAEKLARMEHLRNYKNQFIPVKITSTKEIHELSGRRDVSKKTPPRDVRGEPTGQPAPPAP